MLIEKNGLNIPDYLNSEFFEAALQDIEENFKIQDIRFTMGCDGGDNYCSFVYRVEVNYKTSKFKLEKVSVIVKSIPVDGDREVFGDMQLYEKETKMYFNVLPKLQGLARFNVSPKCYYAIPTPIRTIVLEDLKVAGLRLLDRTKGLDDRHCAVLFKKLGEFHAASMAMAEKVPNIFEEFNTGMYHGENFKHKPTETFFLDTFKCTAKFVEQWPGYEEIARKLKILESDFIKKLGENVETSQDEIKVLNHGDLWTNNIFFKYNSEFSEIPVDVKFIDYQGCVFSSPGIDINYILNSSVQLDVLKHRTEFLLKNFYYDSLKTSLETLCVRNVPTFDDIQKEIERKAYFGMFVAISSALSCIDKESSKDNCFESYSDKDFAMKMRMIACSSKGYQDKIKYVLTRADKIGLLS